MIDRTTGILLSARRTREQEASLVRRSFPVVVGLALFLYSGYCERYLRHDPSGHSLTLYLFSFICFACGLAMSFFLGTTGEILHRTAIFPLTSRVRFVFVGVGAVTNPMAAALLLSGALSVGILYGETMPFRLLSVANFLALMLLMKLLTVCVLLFPLGRVRASTAVSTSLILSMLTLGALLFVVQPSWHIPGVSWAVTGIMAAARGEIIHSMVSLSCLMGTVIVLALIGRRFA